MGAAAAPQAGAVASAGAPPTSLLTAPAGRISNIPTRPYDTPSHTLVTAYHSNVGRAGSKCSGIFSAAMIEFYRGEVPQGGGRNTPCGTAHIRAPTVRRPTAAGINAQDHLSPASSVAVY